MSKESQELCLLVLPSKTNKYLITLYLCRMILYLVLSKPQKVYISNDTRLLTKVICTLINRNYKKVSLKTATLGYPLRYLKIPIVLSIQDDQEFKKLLTGNESNYETLLWTLMNIDSTDSSTLSQLSATSNHDFSKILKLS